MATSSILKKNDAVSSKVKKVRFGGPVAKPKNASSSEETGVVQKTSSKTKKKEKTKDLCGEVGSGGASKPKMTKQEVQEELAPEEYEVESIIGHKKVTFTYIVELVAWEWRP